MSYEVLARRWRPNTWASVVGQGHITRTLSNAIERDRVAHAFLFTGIRGVGKTTVARLLARALNCTDRHGAEPCNECPSCAQIMAGSSVDVLEIDGASNRGIDEVREIIEAARYRPASSTYKIYIIDEVHQLTGPAFNALLKTLEEPPSHVKFLLATTEWQKLPATILSRCQRYDFRRISTVAISGHLAHIAKTDELKVTNDALAFIAREADGSMRDAQSLLEQVVAAGAVPVVAATVAEILGVPDQDAVARCVEALVEADPARIATLAAELRSVGYDAERFLSDVLHTLRHVAVASAAGPESLADTVGEHTIELATRLADKRSQLDLHRIFSTLLHTSGDLRRGTAPDLVLEMGLLKAAALESVASAADLLARAEQLVAGGPGEGSGGSQPASSGGKTAPAAKPSRGRRVDVEQRTRIDEPVVSLADNEPYKPTPAPAQEALVRPETIAERPKRSVEPSSLPADQAERWEAFLTLVQKRHGIDLYVSLSNCEVVSMSAEELVLHPTLAGFRGKLRNPDILERVVALAKEFFGTDVDVRLVADGESSGEGLTIQGIEQERAAKLRADATSDPVVRAAVEILGGTIEKISPLED